MRLLATKPNVIAPNSDFPFGRLRDRAGAVHGTPVTEQVYGDIHQFFEKLMNIAAVVANGLPECQYTGFQLITALTTVITNIASALVATETSARIAADSSEASTRASADSAEATARASADSSEATTRASADTTETNARIAADALKADIAQPAWIAMTLKNGWVNMGGRVSRYRKDSLGRVSLSIRIDGNGVASSQIFCTLPAPFIPTGRARGIVINGSTGLLMTTKLLRVDETGDLNILGFINTDTITAEITYWLDDDNL